MLHFGVFYIFALRQCALPFHCSSVEYLFHFFLALLDCGMLFKINEYAFKSSEIFARISRMLYLILMGFLHSRLLAKHEFALPSPINVALAPALYVLTYRKIEN